MLPKNKSPQESRPFTVLAALFLLSAPVIPCGTFGVPELCSRLTAATGTVYSADAELIDYPVFASVKSGDIGRIRMLVASALHAEWRPEKGGYRLRPVPTKPDEDFPEFTRLYQAACATASARREDHDRGGVPHLDYPLRDLYELKPGEVIRYGPVPTDFIRPLPDAVSELPDTLDKHMIVRRLAAGCFEFPDLDQVQFDSLPPAVETLLGDDLKQVVLTPAEQTFIRHLGTNPESLKIDWSQAAKRDPLAILADHVLPKIGALIKPDLVMALPDLSVFALTLNDDRAVTVRSILAAHTVCDILSVVDGAVVGRLTSCECENRSQAIRSVLAKFLGETGNGVFNIGQLADYVSHQRRFASDSWSDVMLLALTGQVLDQEFIGDYPYNERLYTELAPGDWAKLRSGKPFHPAEFTPRVQHELLDLLLQARARVSREFLDPAQWQTLDFSRLSVTADLTEAPVLIGFTMAGGQVGELRSLALHYERQTGALGHEPLYQPATRRRLKLTIASIGDRERVVTGFSELIPAKTAPTIWRKLPPELAQAFQKALDEANALRHPTSTNPPPANRP